ncbi:MAG: ABC transporter substrate-binding protein [Acutalibacteraceae bacterium]|nr:ABC transporter substrate-binding protein [Acutalibacteraceae bacterium]
MKKYIAMIIALFAVLIALSLLTDNGDVTTTTTVPSEETTEAETTEDKEEDKITIGYFEQKSLNPYITDSPTNRNVASLVYDGLFVLDENYKPEPVIAQSSEIKDGKLTVYLCPDICFSSGSPLTPSDVVYSYNVAKQSSYYAPRLEIFTAAVSGTDCVVFSLANENAYAESCLTFPIVQAGTAVNDIPTGSGRYVLESDESGKHLTVNENSTRNEAMNTSSISLIPITSEKGELYMLQSGDLSYFYDDLSDSQYTKIGANMLRVPLNNLVYLGIKSSSKFMSDKAVKKAVDLAIDKMTIAEAAYSGMCRATDMPFNPDWYALSPLQTSTHTFSTLKAAQTLEDAGYIYAYKHNKFRSKNFEFLEITMLVNEENENRVICANHIHDSLENIGIDVRLSILPYEEYTEALYNGEFDIYLGEVKLPASMDLSCFFKENAAAGYGIDSGSTVAKAFTDFSQGKTDISTFIKVFDDSMPFIPICFRDGVAYYSREITFEGSVTEYEPFLNAYSWALAASAQ